jgi:hypothetical protein
MWYSRTYVKGRPRLVALCSPSLIIKITHCSEIFAGENKLFTPQRFAIPMEIFGHFCVLTYSFASETCAAVRQRPSTKRNNLTSTNNTHLSITLSS